MAKKIDPANVGWLVEFHVGSKYGFDYGADADLYSDLFDTAVAEITSQLGHQPEIASNHNDYVRLTEAEIVDWTKVAEVLQDLHPEKFRRLIEHGLHP